MTASDFLKREAQLSKPFVFSSFRLCLMSRERAYTVSAMIGFGLRFFVTSAPARFR
jgi:hypothetical protein